MILDASDKMLPRAASCCRVNIYFMQEAVWQLRWEEKEIDGKSQKIGEACKFLWAKSKSVASCAWMCLSQAGTLRLLGSAGREINITVQQVVSEWMSNPISDLWGRCYIQMRSIDCLDIYVFWKFVKELHFMDFVAERWIKWIQIFPNDTIN